MVEYRKMYENEMLIQWSHVELLCFLPGKGREQEKKKTRWETLFKVHSCSKGKPCMFQGREAWRKNVNLTFQKNAQED